MQFEAFVDRLRDAVAAAMPTAKVEVETAEARVVRPDPEHRPERAQPSDAPGYDPYLAYYPSPLGFLPEALLWSTLFSMAMPPHYVVVGHDNHPQGFVDEPGIDTASTHVADGGDTGWGSDDQTAGTTDDDDLGQGDADAGGDSWMDSGGGDLGGDDW